eukprot:581595-Amphidinium_carterae.1
MQLKSASAHVVEPMDDGVVGTHLPLKPQRAPLNCFGCLLHDFGMQLKMRSIAHQCELAAFWASSEPSNPNPQSRSSRTTHQHVHNG